jgi:hypothetical protein
VNGSQLREDGLEPQNDALRQPAVAWYGASATVAVSGPVAVTGGKALSDWAWLNPIAWRRAMSFAFNLLGPLSPWQPDTDEYPCGEAGQMGSAIVWSASHPKGQ